MPPLSWGKVGGAPTTTLSRGETMKKKIMIVLGGLLAVAMVFGAVRATTAYAQESTTVQFGDGGGHGHGGGGRGLGDTELAAAAKVLGMTADELSTALSEGKTLEDLATTAKVDIQDVQDAITAVHAEEMRAQIKAGVADGTISQEKADWLLEGLDKGFLDGGRSFGLHGDRPTDKTVQPTQTTTP